jgi:hypothetical protein
VAWPYPATAYARFLPDLVLIPRRHKAHPSLSGVAETIPCQEDLTPLNDPQLVLRDHASDDQGDVGGCQDPSLLIRVGIPYLDRTRAAQHSSRQLSNFICILSEGQSLSGLTSKSLDFVFSWGGVPAGFGVEFLGTRYKPAFRTMHAPQPCDRYEAPSYPPFDEEYLSGLTY